MLTFNQTLDEFLATAVSKLIEKRASDFTWSQDEATTTAAIETILEYVGEPNPLCFHSGVCSEIDGLSAWDRRFSIYEASKTQASQSIAPSDFLWGIENVLYSQTLIKRRLGEHDGIRNDSDAWLTTRWEKLHSILRPDAHLQGRYELPDYKTKSAWLNARIGFLKLHDFEPNNVIERIEPLLKSISIPPWESYPITAIETTAIVAQFLFHRCTFYYLKNSPIKNELTKLLHPTLNWLIEHQNADGSWASSPHSTAHCIRAIAEHADKSEEIKSSVERAVQYLVSQSSINTWKHFETYEQIEVLLTIIRVAKLESFRSFSSSIRIEGGFHQPNVFISYAGCDTDFALELSKALEKQGVPVWFAEWDLDYGDDIVQQIQHGLESTKAFIVILTPDSIARPWVRKEISAAFSQAIGGQGKLIIPLRYKECEIPPFLRAHKWVDFTVTEGFEKTVQDLARRLKQKPKKRS